MELKSENVIVFYAFGLPCKSILSHFFCPEVTLHLLGDFTGLRDTEGYREKFSQGKSASLGRQRIRSADMTHPVREHSPGETRRRKHVIEAEKAGPMDET